eukprot:6516-Heterococcus_DN1.PRE.2
MFTALESYIMPTTNEGAMIVLTRSCKSARSQQRHAHATQCSISNAHWALFTAVQCDTHSNEMWRERKIEILEKTLNLMIPLLEQDVLDRLREAGEDACLNATATKLKLFIEIHHTAHALAPLHCFSKQCV